MKRRFNNNKIINTTQLINERTYNDIRRLFTNRLHTAPQFMDKLEYDGELVGHNGCVNCLDWSDNGRFLASASDDYHVMIWDPFRLKRMTVIKTPHHGNIFSVKFIPKSNNSLIATGAGDSSICVFDINREDVPIYNCECHSLRVKRLATATDTANMFWTAGEDGLVLQLDIREPHDCGTTENKIALINLKNACGVQAEVKCVTINARRPELIAIGSRDCYARLYDRRMIKLNTIYCDKNVTDNIGCVNYFSPGHLNTPTNPDYHCSITYLTFSPDGNELLVNMGSEHIYLYDINKPCAPLVLKLPFAEYTEDLKDINKRKLPENIENDKKVANVMLENKRFLKAIDKYSELIEQAPDCPTLFLNRATALMKRGWYGDFYAAFKDCTIAIQKDPTYIKAYFRLSRSLFALNDIPKAQLCLDELYRLFPKLKNDASCRMLQKDIDRALIESSNSDSTHNHNVDFDNIPAYEFEWRKKAKDYNERFVGHCNTTTDIKEANYFGKDGKFIVAGSDDGNIIIWERPTSVVKYIYQGDKAIVNCVQPHPYICVLATSGIDNEIRLWSPLDNPKEVKRHANESIDILIKNNQKQMQGDAFLRNPILANEACRTN